MRTIGLLFFLLFLSTPVAWKTDPSPKTYDRFIFQQPYIGSVITGQPDQKPGEIDTAALKQSAWYSNAINYIEESEYGIKPVETPDCFGSPNRQQNLRAFYTASTFTLEPRENDNWKLESVCQRYFFRKRKDLFTATRCDRYNRQEYYPVHTQQRIYC